MILRFFLAEKPGFEFKINIRPRSDRMKTTHVSEFLSVLNKFSSVRANVEPESTSSVLHRSNDREPQHFLLAVDKESIDAVLDALIRGVAFPSDKLVSILNETSLDGVSPAANLESCAKPFKFHFPVQILIIRFSFAVN
jgi:hypothetical protein